MTPLLHDEAVMGTVFSFRVETGTLSRQALEQAVGSACRLLHRVDSMFSTWIPDSPMSRLRRGDARRVSPEILHVLELCQAAKQISGGWFDPWAMPGGVDPTGLVKGWAADRALTILTEAGVDSAVINAGGDIAAVSADGSPWRIGIRHPWRPEALACVAEVRSAVATSAYYERGPHLVVPEGFPTYAARASRPVSASVTGPRLAFADALATALCLGGRDLLPRLEATDGYEGYVIFADGGEAATGGFPFARVPQAPPRPEAAVAGANRPRDPAEIGA